MTCQVILEIKVKPESIDATRKWFRSVLPDTRAYDGFVTLHMAQNQDNPAELMIVEQWDTRAAYEKYLAWRGERGDMNALGAMLAGEPRIRFFNYFGV
jgi:quinol monooxygenase YgiN